MLYMLSRFFTSSVRWLTYGLIAFLPYAAWSATQDSLFSPKLYLLSIGVLILLLLLAVVLVANRRISLSSTSVDVILVTLLLSMATLSMLVPTNKVQALLNPNTGLAFWLGLLILYGVCTALRLRPLVVAFYSAGVAALVITMQSLFPLVSSTLPKDLAFLAIPGATLVGSYLETSFFYGFFTLLGLGMLWKAKRHRRSPSLLVIAITILLFITSLASGYRASRTEQILPSYLSSWRAAVETLQSPQLMLTGFGSDNFIVAFTKAKTPAYNSQSDWSQNYRVARSGILQIWAEYGLPIVVLLILLLTTAIFRTYKSSRDDEVGTENIYLTIQMAALIAGLILLPLSPAIVFLLMMLLAEVVTETSPESSLLQLSFKRTPAATLPFATVLCLMSGAAGYGLYHVVGAELAFKKGIDNLSKGSVVYEQHRRAIQQNPFIERYRISFSQINLVLANSIMSKEKPSDQDKQTASQAIQVAIGEAKAAVSLNPLKSGNWLALATTYRSVIPVAKGADAWAIAAYQRAIILDPSNPSIRLQLGGVYYGLKQYDRAEELFKEALSLKADNPNFYYNYAWALYQGKKYDQAVSAMENVLKLIKDTKGEDYKKAQKELEDFKKAAAANKPIIPAKEQPEESNTDGEGNLSLPQPQPTTSPQIILPTGAGIASESAR
ncbi:MAG: Tetratricopeptide repeat protein [Microgenomates bacterium OLB22]|nr:MAG: Tetratricopeptide repeat protein [Microgenomates bacterium OLB22]